MKFCYWIERDGKTKYYDNEEEYQKEVERNERIDALNGAYHFLFSQSHTKKIVCETEEEEEYVKNLTKEQYRLGFERGQSELKYQVLKRIENFLFNKEVI